MSGLTRLDIGGNSLEEMPSVLPNTLVALMVDENIPLVLKQADLRLLIALPCLHTFWFAKNRSGDCNWSPESVEVAHALRIAKPELCVDAVMYENQFVQKATGDGLWLV